MRRKVLNILKSPFIKNGVQISAIYSLGDFTQQRLISKVEVYDYENTRNVAIIGGAFSPLYVLWYRYLARYLPGTSPRTIIKKIALDELIIGVPGMFVFFTGMSVLEGKKDIFEELKQKGPTAYACNFAYWPMLMYGIFRVVPVASQPMAVACGDFLWSIFLCYYKMRGHVEVPSVVSADQSTPASSSGN